MVVYPRLLSNPIIHIHLFFAYTVGMFDPIPLMPRVLMNYDHWDYNWRVHFIEADCRTLIGPKTRYYRIATVDGLRAFVIRCNVEDLEKFEYSLRAWGRDYVNLTDEQYAKLKLPPKEN
jgi:hypothetical protein